MNAYGLENTTSATLAEAKAIYLATRNSDDQTRRKYFNLYMEALDNAGDELDGKMVGHTTTH